MRIESRMDPVDSGEGGSCGDAAFSDMLSWRGRAAYELRSVAEGISIVTMAVTCCLALPALARRTDGYSERMEMRGTTTLTDPSAGGVRDTNEVMGSTGSSWSTSMSWTDEPPVCGATMPCWFPTRAASSGVSVGIHLPSAFLLTHCFDQHGRFPSHA